MFALNLGRDVDRHTAQDPSAVLSGMKSMVDYMSADKLLSHFSSDKQAFIPPTAAPEPGCMALWMDPSGDGHVSLVMSVDGDSMKTVDGNLRVNSDYDKESQYRDGNHQILVSSERWEETDSPQSSVPKPKMKPAAMRAVAQAMSAKTYRGCVRVWSPAKGEEAVWKQGLAQIQKRYSEIKPFDLKADTGLYHKVVYGSCIDERSKYSPDSPLAHADVNESRTKEVMDVAGSYVGGVESLFGTATAVGAH